MAERGYIFCTRMYNVADAATAAWRRLMEETARVSGVGLRFEPFPFPNDILRLWELDDLGCAFICGRPFALGGCAHRPLAVPLRVRTGGTPYYTTKLLVRGDSPFRCLEDTFGHRLGLTTPHSLSGYLAVREHLAPYQKGQQGQQGGKGRKAPEGPLYAGEVLGLHTPMNCLKALADRRAEVVPLDGYCHELLERHAPDTLAHARVVAETRQYPMPLLVASPRLADDAYEALRAGLFTAARLPGMRRVMDTLGLAGFGVPDIPAYEPLARDADGASAAGQARLA